LAIEGGWQRGETTPIAPEQSPELLRRLGLRAAVQSRYRGPGNVAISRYEMTSSAGAFEAAQKDRPAPGRLAFHHNRYFVVIESPDLDHKALFSMARALEQALR
jgi:hypothetical protein